jgi:hypothetical protein
MDGFCMDQSCSRCSPGSNRGVVRVHNPCRREGLCRPPGREQMFHDDGHILRDPRSPQECRAVEAEVVPVAQQLRCVGTTID